MLPTAALVMEVVTGICANVFFDPISTPLHLLLVALVPVVNCVLWRKARQGNSNVDRRLELFVGITVAISLVYTIVFLPLLPFAALMTVRTIFLLFLPAIFTLLPLAPLSALGATLAIKSRIAMRTSVSTGIGFLLGVLLVAAAELPRGLTNYALALASSADEKIVARGVNLLQRFGTTELILERCYGIRNDDFITWLRRSLIDGTFGSNFDRLSPGQVNEADQLHARQIFFRVTGESFNSLPTLKQRRGLWGWGFDTEQGGTSVGGRVDELELVQSMFHGSIDADARVSYTEWTLVVKNGSDFQQEARFQLTLPAGGVISRATLWIDGEEHEAAFGTRAQARAAYENVVRVERRDPLLVSSLGANRALVQLFPVGERGGERKIRIGITAPLLREESSTAILRLPGIDERNFSLQPGLIHSVWFESRRPLEMNGKAVKRENLSDKLYAVRGELEDSHEAAFIRVTRDPEVVQTQSEWRRNGSKAHVYQRLNEEFGKKYTSVVVVVDGSISMKSERETVVSALSTLAEQIDLTTIVATDEKMKTLETKVKSDASTLLRELRKGKYFVGGKDNLPALIQAWDAASANEGSAIIWIHGPQPVFLERPEDLTQYFLRRPGGVTLYDFQLVPGPNVISDELSRMSNVHRVARLTDGDSDLKRFIGEFLGFSKRVVATRWFAREGEEPMTNARTTSDHLARLTAFAEIISLWQTRKSDALKTAEQLGMSYQLVTPLTSAVVLESRADYLAAGLEPGKEATVPTIPEPATYLLMLVAMTFLYLASRRCSPKWNVG